MAGNVPGGTPTGLNSQASDSRQAAAQIPTIAVRASPRADLLSAPIMEKEADRRAAILDDKPATFYLADNPDAKVKWLWVLGRIAARTYRPTVAKIADLYNGLGLDHTTDYGRTVEYYTQRKPWLDR